MKLTIESQIKRLSFFFINKTVELNSNFLMILFQTSFGFLKHVDCVNFTFVVEINNAATY